MSIELEMTIGSESVSGTESFAVENPATGEVIGHAPEATKAHLDQAMAAASAASAGWASDQAGRRAALRAAADVIDSASAELAHLITLEQGKPLYEARVESAGTAAALRHFAEAKLEDTVLDRGDRIVTVRRRPVGVVAAITPWNSPVVVAAAKMAPALAAGNTFVLKPSPFTPLSTLRLGELLRPVLPPGVLNIVSGGNDLGAWITEHPTPRMVSFTGSPRTGRLVAASAAMDFKRVVLELGGNDPAVVLDDANVDEVAEALFWGAFGNAGQTCIAIKRVYAPATLHAPLTEALAELAKSVVVGDGLEPGTKMGPLTTGLQRQIVEDLVDDAVRNGAQIAAGGSRLDRAGNFYQPTILTSVNDGFRIVDEEQFGPALPVVSYDDLDDLLARINRSNYGLGASVWSSDFDRGNAIADRIDAGTTWVNNHRGMVFPLQPVAGLKHSGLGIELGQWGLESYTNVVTRHAVKKPTPVGAERK